MKKQLFFILCLLLLLPIKISATGGGLQKNSIKTCPNGVTYGKHRDGNGGTHWHVAITNGTNYYASGEAIYEDPCPDYKKNEGTAGSTKGGSSSSSNNSRNNNYYTNDSINDNSEIIIEEKSNDNTIKRVLVDEKEITVSDNMNYETKKKNIRIKIETNDSKSKVAYDNKELNNGGNEINIVVTAENGDKRNYILTVNKIKGQGTATIQEFKLGTNKAKFENKKATITRLKNDDSLDYSYKLSNNKAKLIIFLNGNEVTKFKELKKSDVIKLTVIDEDDNENNYEITIDEYSTLVSLITEVLSFVVGISVFALPIYIIFKKKKKKTDE